MSSQPLTHVHLISHSIPTIIELHGKISWQVPDCAAYFNYICRETGLIFSQPFVPALKCFSLSPNVKQVTFNLNILLLYILSRVNDFITIISKLQKETACGTDGCKIHLEKVLEIIINHCFKPPVGFYKQPINYFLKYQLIVYCFFFEVIFKWTFWII